MVLTIPPALNGTNFSGNWPANLGYLQRGFKMQIFTPAASANVRIGKRRDDVVPLGTGASPIYQGTPIQANAPVEINWEGDVFAIAEGTAVVQAEVNIYRA